MLRSGKLENLFNQFDESKSLSYGIAVVAPQVGRLSACGIC